MEITEGKDPLEFMIEHNKIACGVLFHNLDFLRILEYCF